MGEPPRVDRDVDEVEEVAVGALTGSPVVESMQKMPSVHTSPTWMVPGVARTTFQVGDPARRLVDCAMYRYHESPAPPPGVGLP